jgi:ATP phosphoribosyltransferase regulatory subunit
MGGIDRWLLPDGVKELLCPDARRLENLRRKLLDLHHGWGYDLVMPPLMEYIESLLTGTGNDLALETFKVIDQLTGRTMGSRADTTPQVARMDAHSLHHRGINRLCYANTVLHTSATMP